MEKSLTVTVTINGESHEGEQGRSIAEMLAALGIDPARVAVERNREIVPRGMLGDVTIEEGDAYEIVHFVGGG